MAISSWGEGGVPPWWLDGKWIAKAGYSVRVQENVKVFRAILSSLGLGTEDGHKPNWVPIESGNSIQDHQILALALPLPFLVPFLYQVSWKGFKCLGGNTWSGFSLQGHRTTANAQDNRLKLSQEGHWVRARCQAVPKRAKLYRVLARLTTYPKYNWISSTTLSPELCLVLGCAHFITSESVLPEQLYLFCLTLIFLT